MTLTAVLSTIALVLIVGVIDKGRAQMWPHRRSGGVKPSSNCKPIHFPVCEPPHVKKCKYDYYGCPVTCTCVKQCPPLPCGYPALSCPQGVRLDKNGCLTCECRDKCCPTPEFKHCPSGLKNKKTLDKTGCPAYKCTRY